MEWTLPWRLDMKEAWLGIEINAEFRRFRRFLISFLEAPFDDSDSIQVFLVPWKS